MHNTYTRGSEWNRWDLHFHTPSSHDYGDKSATDADIINTLKENGIKAVAITDHNVIDTARIDSLRKEAGGDLVIFPGIELCTESRGSEPIHIIGVFPENSDHKHIWKELEVRLNISKQLKDGRKPNEIYCVLIDASKHIHELGGIVIVHAGSKTNSIETITNSLPVKMAEKKDIADHIDVFELGQEADGKDYKEIVFKSIKKQYPLILCSDNHNIKKYSVKERLWIKSDPTFEGLMQITFEPEDRIFIGEEPEIEIRVRNNQRRYIKSLHIGQVEHYDGRHGIWFKDEEIELSKELVAIIGNKGSGKSAVADIAGLLGNSHNQKYTIQGGKTENLFSFLNADKFLKSSCATNFIGSLNWYTGDPNTSHLDKDTDLNTPEYVEYLPQKYLEKICTNIEDDEFRQKLNEVIFGYVEEKDRFGTTNLVDLTKYLMSQIDEDIKIAKDLLHTKNGAVVEIEKKLTQDYLKEISEKLKLKEAEVKAHNEIKPKEVIKPTKDSELATKSVEEITKLDKQVTKLNEEVAKLQVEQTEVGKLVEDLRQGKQAVERQIETALTLEQKYKDLFTTAGLKFEDIFKISANYESLDKLIGAKTKRLGVINKLLLSVDAIERMNLNSEAIEAVKKQSLIFQIEQLDIQKKKIVDGLDKPNQLYQSYLKEEMAWQKKHKNLVGDDENPILDTLSWLKKELENITKKYPSDLANAREERLKVSKDIYAKKIGQIAFYNNIKQSIDGEISKYGKDLEGYDISVEASLRFDSSFYEEFFKYINQAVRGSFCGADEGRAMLKKITDGVNDWHEESAVLVALQSTIEHLDMDKRVELPKEENKAKDIFKQMKLYKEPRDFYDYLFGFDYLKPKYDLKVDKKDLSELSPGERGGLLLIFYLMLDRRDIPLIIDQPEDNLDNKSIYEILVRFLKKAKRKRQIIMVTHNPNLAVVADAEQIIHVSIDKKNQNDFDFTSGSIENPEINKLVVDILEGTMPAFDNRRLKYRKQTTI